MAKTPPSPEVDFTVVNVVGPFKFTYNSLLEVPQYTNPPCYPAVQVTIPTLHPACIVIVASLALFMLKTPPFYVLTEEVIVFVVVNLTRMGFDPAK